MHITFIVEGYSIPEDPIQPFVRNLIVHMAKKGIECSVIAPQSISRALTHKVPVRKTFWVDKCENAICINVYQPIYFTFSNRFPRLNNFLQIVAVKRAYRRIKKPIDVLYAHFWHMGIVASKINELNLPLFIASGEDHITVRDRYKESEIKVLQNQLSGVIYVSSQAYIDAVSQSLENDIPYIIAPNGYDPSLFKPLDKKECREELGFPQDAFIVSFVGSFDERKGVLRVKQAIEELDGDSVHVCYIGKGDENPNSDKTLFCGTVPHGDLPIYLSASDGFVLPTRSEGCCNAIVEALGCHLPVISSDGRFNDDILDDSCSIRVNPNSISEISRALKMLRDNTSLRKNLAEGAAIKAKELTIGNRTERIIGFVLKRINE